MKHPYSYSLRAARPPPDLRRVKLRRLRLGRFALFTTQHNEINEWQCEWEHRLLVYNGIRLSGFQNTVTPLLMNGVDCGGEGRSGGAGIRDEVME